MIAISLKNISKFYDERPIFENINFDIPEGKITGLSGPNASGKTTLLKIILGLVEPTKGTVTIYNKNNRDNEIKKIVGYVPQEIALYDDLTTVDNLLSFGELYNLTVEKLNASLKDIVTFLELEKYKNIKVKNLSTGYKRIVSLGCALVHSPKILFLDEPTTGLHSSIRTRLWDYFKKLSTMKKTIVVSTHYPEELKYVDYMISLDKQYI